MYEKLEYIASLKEMDANELVEENRRVCTHLDELQEQIWDLELRRDDAMAKKACIDVERNLRSVRNT